MNKKVKTVAGAAIAGGATVASATILDDVELGMSQGKETTEDAKVAHREEKPEDKGEDQKEENFDDEMLAEEANIEVEETEPVSEEEMVAETETDADEMAELEAEAEADAVAEGVEALDDEVLVEAETAEPEATEEVMEEAVVEESPVEDGEAIEEAETAETEAPQAAETVEQQPAAEVRWSVTESDDPIPAEEELGEGVEELIDATCEVPEENSVEAEKEVMDDPDLLDEFIDKANGVVDDLLGSNDSSIPDFENNADVNEFL